jgi:hypothetical protein
LIASPSAKRFRHVRTSFAECERPRKRRTIVARIAWAPTAVTSQMARTKPLAHSVDAMAMNRIITSTTRAEDCRVWANWRVSSKSKAGLKPFVEVRRSRTSRIFIDTARRRTGVASPRSDATVSSVPTLILTSFTRAPGRAVVRRKHGGEMLTFR